jgi:DNA-binding response OmpR family regulator
MKIFPSGLDGPDEDDYPEPDDGALNGNETVLLVEDESLLRYLIATTLQRFGYRVLDAADGEEAIQIASTHSAPIHLVISDIVMPRMNGIELVLALRRWFPGTGVLFMSGFSEGTHVAMAAELTGSHFIAKPFTMRALIVATRSALEWRPHQRAG